MRACSPALGLGLWRRAFLVAPLFLCLHSTYSQAQDVAEAARQGRARKNEPHQKPHVYTDEDLKRDKILTPEDQDRAEARKKEKAPRRNVPENAETLPLAAPEPAESLGEIARRYRKERKETEESEAAEAAKRKLTPFPYTAPEPVLAAPRPGIAPLLRAAPELPVRKSAENSPLLRPHHPSNANSSRTRISPFQPRPLSSVPAAPPVLVAPSAPPAPSVALHVIPGPEHSLTANAVPRPATNGLRQIQVQRGDSWWRLASQYLGSGTRWRELRDLNSDVTELAALLREGRLIRVPETPGVRGSSSQPSIVVKKGDTLWVLARAHLGRGSAWGCLASANPQISDFTRLAIGSVLHVPDPAALQVCEQSTFGSPSR